MSRRWEHVVVTCEHATNRVPPQYASWFATRRAQQALASHRGHDIGALGLARAIARQLGVCLTVGEVSRLVIELNRSPGHPALFSEFTRDRGRTEQQQLLRRYYEPYRARLERTIARQVARQRRVLHLSIHSFTPGSPFARTGGRRSEEQRAAEIGLLYDPGRRLESEFCRAWQAALRALAPEWRIRRNYPYRGVSDGFTTYLRKKFSARSYAGIELEVNQALFERVRQRDALTDTICRSLAELLDAG